ncbi:MAG TPA: TlpA disulfide reductase family protein, partial [Chitinophagaceae bacterium]|nr:TlpA disulfide reductase family protein [Chitinophagaceae bacterium]
CVAEFSNVKKMYKKYHAKGFEVIGISMDDATAKQRVKDLVAKNKLTWPQSFEGKGFDENGFVKAQQVASLPAVFLIDKDGMIIDRDARGERLEELIKQHL